MILIWEGSSIDLADKFESVRKHKGMGVTLAVMRLAPREKKKARGKKESK